MTGTIYRDCMFVNVMKTALNFTVTFEREYNVTFVATLIAYIVKHMIDSTLLTVVSAQY